jgi:hypothetical protein
MDAVGTEAATHGAQCGSVRAFGVWRRGRDSNPRRPLPAWAVFKTAPFNHSGTPPRRSVSDQRLALGWWGEVRAATKIWVERGGKLHAAIGLRAVFEERR